MGQTPGSEVKRWRYRASTFSVDAAKLLSKKVPKSVRAPKRGPGQFLVLSTPGVLRARVSPLAMGRRI